MVEEVINFVPNKGLVVDGTIGKGGHAFEILRRKDVRLLGLDKDPSQVEWAKKRLAQFQDRVTVINGGFEDLPSIMCETASFILLDLGISSDQLKASRGFSFMEADAPLDLRFNPTLGKPASQMIQEASVTDLRKIFEEYAQVPKAYELSKRIKERALQGRMNKIADLVEVCREIYGERLRGKHCGTLPIQGLRIWVNRELDCLKMFVKSIPHIISEGGRVAIISYHSGEDRIVKNGYKELKSLGFQIVTKKPLRPSDDEVRRNRRARSAKLRVIERGSIWHK